VRRVLGGTNLIASFTPLTTKDKVARGAFSLAPLPERSAPDPRWPFFLEDSAAEVGLG